MLHRAGSAALLIERGADVNKEDTVKGVTPLKVAVEDDNMAMVELLIKKFAKVDHVNRNGTTRLQDAARLGNVVRWCRLKPAESRVESELVL